MADLKNHGGEGSDSDKKPRSPEDWSRVAKRSEQEIQALDGLLAGVSFPASKESLAAHLAVEAFSRGGGRAAEFHDLVVQLEDRRFPNLESLHQAIRERHAWERTHPAV